MTFYPPKIIRFCYRYAIMGILVILPLVIMIISLDEKVTSPDEIAYPIIGCSVLAILGSVIIQLGLWEKMFSKVSISGDEIVWKCPMRQTRRITIAECIEVGAFLEHEGNGIPTEQIYFSSCANIDPLEIRKLMRCNRKIIVFWYSEELYQHIKQTMNSGTFSRMVAYRQKRNKRES